MNVAIALAISAAVAQLALAAVFSSLSRAAGWRRSLIFAAIAVCGAVYALMNLVSLTPDLAPSTRFVAFVVSYVGAAGQAALWLIFARSSPDTGTLTLSRLDRVVLAMLAVLVGLALVPGAYISDEITTMALPQFGVTYWSATLTPLGNLATAAIVLSFLLPLGSFVGRARRGDSGGRTLVVGFAIFFPCALNEILVAGGVYEFLYVVDLGFGAIIVSMVVDSIQRVVRDAAALSKLSNRLAGEALASQSERDEARAALVDLERLGHEINNPLAYVRESLGQVSRHFETTETTASIREALSDASEGARRIDEVVRELRGLGPMPRESGPPPAPTSAELEAAPPTIRVLLVDDDERVGRALGRMLRGYDVTTASGGLEALDHLERDPDFAAIVCDVAMPEMDGMELSSEIAKRWPALRPRMLFVTGGAPGSREFLERADVTWLQKPFDSGALRHKLEQLGVPAPMTQAH